MLVRVALLLWPGFSECTRVLGHLSVLDEAEELAQQRIGTRRTAACPNNATQPGNWPKLEELAEIGSGSYGTVYLCNLTQPQHGWGPSGTTVAVKVSDFTERTRRISNWLAEHQAEDTGFVKVYGVAENLVAMERVDGDLLDWAVHRAVMEEIPNSPKRELKEKLAATCEALKRLHAKEIIHHDIKPDNIGFVGEKAKFLDMDLACFLGDCEDSVHEGSNQKGCVGTRRFMSPELWWCNCRQDIAQKYWKCAPGGGTGKAADIYAFGRSIVDVVQLSVWGSMDWRGWPPYLNNTERLLEDLTTAWSGVEWQTLLNPDPKERHLPSDCAAFFSNLGTLQQLPEAPVDEERLPEDGRFLQQLSPFLQQAVDQGNLTYENAVEMARKAKVLTSQRLEEHRLKTLDKAAAKRAELAKVLEGTGGINVAVERHTQQEAQQFNAIGEVIEEEDEEEEE